MKINRKQYIDYMTFREASRPLLAELFGPLIGLPEEWKQQGAHESELDLSAFGFDYADIHRINANTGLIGDTKPQVIEENSEYSITLDSLGRKMKLIKTSATIPLPLNYPVTDMDSWLKIKPRYAYSEERFSRNWLAEARQAQEAGALVVAQIPGGFDEARQLLGEEKLCLAYYEQPELIHDILGTIGGTARRVLDRVSRKITVDQLSVHEDMAGKSGCLIGPKQIDEFIKPYYRSAWEILQARGCSMFRQDSDGNMNGVVDAFLDCGVTEMYPMEPAAGMDIVALRRKYGTRLAMSGGIDKHVLRQDTKAIRAELEYKLQPSMQGGGMLFALDHRIPNGTPLENYRFYVRTAKELLGIDPDSGSGWGRMAF
jgi:uroporphyrinogen-III decarboxylase